MIILLINIASQVSSSFILQYKEQTSSKLGSDSKESASKVGNPSSVPGLERFPAGRHGSPLQYSCLENPHGQRALAGYSQWGCKELDATKPSTAALEIPT